VETGKDAEKNGEEEKRTGKMGFLAGFTRISGGELLRAPWKWL
jgi:hypothetical protein